MSNCYMKVRAGIYVRISEDGEGRRAGVKRQDGDCRRICAERGWEVVAGQPEAT